MLSHYTKPPLKTQAQHKNQPTHESKKHKPSTQGKNAKKTTVGKIIIQRNASHKKQIIKTAFKFLQK